MATIRIATLAALTFILAASVHAASTDTTLSSLQQSALAKRNLGPFAPDISQALNFQDKAWTYGLGFSTAQTTDNLSHGFFVVVESSGSRKPSDLIFMSSSDQPTLNEVFYYRTTLDGDLRTVLRLAIPKDKAGALRKADAEGELLEVADAAVQDRFKHELDFWLKNAYRKPPPKKSSKPKKKSP